jgi:hypothetical protein
MSRCGILTRYWFCSLLVSWDLTCFTMVSCLWLTFYPEDGGDTWQHSNVKIVFVNLQCYKEPDNVGWWGMALWREVVEYTFKKNSMVWVRERTIPTERPPLVGKVIANFYGWRVPRGQRDGYLRPYSRFSRQEPLLFYRVAPQLYSRDWVDPVSDPLFFFLVVPRIEPGPPHL